MRRLSESAKTFEPTRVIDHLGYPVSSRPWRPEPLHEENPRSRPHVTSLILHSFDSSQQLRCQPLSWAQLVGDLPHQQNVIHDIRSEEHTSELQSRFDLVCRLLLEKKKI